MGFRKILLQLKELIKQDNKIKKHTDAIRKLLYKLKDKEIKLKNQIKETKDNKKLKELRLNLKIIYAQQKKGEKILQEKL